MGNLQLYQIHHGTTCLHCHLLIQDLGSPAFSLQELPVSVSELLTFSIPSLGFHRHTKLLLCSCHGLGDGVLDVDVHWDTINDRHVCCVRSLGDVSGSERHCW